MKTINGVDITLPDPFKSLATEFHLKQIETKFDGVTNGYVKFDIDIIGPFVFFSQPRTRGYLFTLFVPNYTPYDPEPRGEKFVFQIQSVHNLKYVDFLFNDLHLAHKFFCYWGESLGDISLFVLRNYQYEALVSDKDKIAALFEGCNKLVNVMLNINNVSGMRFQTLRLDTANVGFDTMLSPIVTISTCTVPTRCLSYPLSCCFSVQANSSKFNVPPKIVYFKCENENVMVKWVLNLFACANFPQTSQSPKKSLSSPTSPKPSTDNTNETTNNIEVASIHEQQIIEDDVSIVEDNQTEEETPIMISVEDISHEVIESNDDSSVSLTIPELSDAPVEPNEEWKENEENTEDNLRERLSELNNERSHMHHRLEYVPPSFDSVKELLKVTSDFTYDKNHTNKLQHCLSLFTPEELSTDKLYNNPIEQLSTPEIAANVVDHRLANSKIDFSKLLDFSFFPDFDLSQFCDGPATHPFLEELTHLTDRIHHSMTVDKVITIRPPSTPNSSYFCVDKSFSFREIMDGQTSQQECFEIVALPLLTDFLRGCDVLIFCYGNTNAGKTYTVSGTTENPGILRRSMDFIVPRIISSKSKHKANLYASFVEVYNERINDLLNPNNQNLKLGINYQSDVEIKGVTELPVNTMDDITTFIQKGENVRHFGFTELNNKSSRSHSIFRLKLVYKKRISWLSIVDLAGSERLSVINSTVTSFKEACNINKSMLSLGKCIRSLKEQSLSKNKKNQIPYRESKLTHLFKTFFEPINRPSKAVMIINVSPALIQIEDTIFSLTFAAEASQCVIRQVSRPDGDILDSDDCDDILCNEEIETKQQIETRIKAELKKEMDAFILKKEEEFQKQMERMNATCQGIFLNRFESSTLKQQSQQAWIQDCLVKLEEYDEEIDYLLKKNQEIEKHKNYMKAELRQTLNWLKSAKETNVAILNQNKKMKEKAQVMRKKSSFMSLNKEYSSPLKKENQTPNR
ncbi:Kinesin motor domain containing protein [Histomonas meleagridis]|uniref:Kinesin motor domain containing protein n=1 Tax=Histomonas meleagridis TaxID=135588 RepID=UPI003559E13D|nr:Kinesin motor domain containing protein [Histomonas meleagridis]KAH0806681.1 Kinesin motor domain containing protein [Histomonas meleagridis]